MLDDTKGSKKFTSVIEGQKTVIRLLAFAYFAACFTRYYEKSTRAKLLILSRSTFVYEVLPIFETTLRFDRDHQGELE